MSLQQCVLSGLKHPRTLKAPEETAKSLQLNGQNVFPEIKCVRPFGRTAVRDGRCFLEGSAEIENQFNLFFTHIYPTVINFTSV